jgi:hypothetical protein
MGKKIAYKANREGVAERFVDTAVQKSIEMDLALIDHYDKLLSDIELYIVNTAKQHDVNAFYRLGSVPGIGKILALVILYEVQACVSELWAHERQTNDSNLRVFNELRL